MVNPKVVLLIFVTGKIVLTGSHIVVSLSLLLSLVFFVFHIYSFKIGAKSIQDCQTALTNILPVIDQFKTIPGSVQVKNADETRQVRARKGR